VTGTLALSADPRSTAGLLLLTIVGALSVAAGVISLGLGLLTG
jgi:hypothetical protein